MYICCIFRPNPLLATRTYHVILITQNYATAKWVTLQDNKFIWNLRPEFNSSTQNYAIKRAKLFDINSSTIAVHPRVTSIFNDLSELKEKTFNHFH